MALTDCSDVTVQTYGNLLDREERAYELVYLEPLIYDEATVTWSLKKTRTRVGFASGCDIVLPLERVLPKSKISHGAIFAIVVCSATGCVRVVKTWDADETRKMSVQLCDVTTGLFDRDDMLIFEDGGEFRCTVVSRFRGKIVFEGTLSFRIQVKNRARRVDCGVSLFDKLPTELLRPILSNLDPDIVINCFMPAYPALAATALSSNVAWRSSPDFGPKVLDHMRFLALVAGASLEELEIREIDYPAPIQRKITFLMSQAIEKLTLCGRPDMCLDRVLPDTVTEIQFRFEERNVSEDPFVRIEEGWVPESLDTVRVLSDGPLKIGSAFFRLFGHVPNMHFEPEPRRTFWANAQQSLANVKSLSIIRPFVDTQITLAMFPNLETVTFRSYELAVEYLLLESYPTTLHTVIFDPASVEMYSPRNVYYLMCVTPTIKHLRLSLAHDNPVEDAEDFPHWLEAEAPRRLPLESCTFMSAPFHPRVVVEAVKVMDEYVTKEIAVDGRFASSWLSEAVSEFQKRVGGAGEVSVYEDAVDVELKMMDGDPLHLLELFSADFKAWIVEKREDSSCRVHFEWKYSSYRHSFFSIAGYSFRYVKN